MTSQPLISVAIPNWNGAAYLERCLQSLEHQDYASREILVIDNGSTDASIETVERVAPQAIVIRQARNDGFAAAVNAGIRAARGEWVAVLNNDTEAAPSWLVECASGIDRHPAAAFFACRILDMKGGNRIYSAGDCFLRSGIGYRRGQDLPDCGEYRTECEIFSACGCAALYRKSVLQEVQGFDGRFFAYLEDVDLGLRLRAAGYHGFYLPSALIYHHGSATSGGEFSALSVRLRTRNALLLLLKSVPASILWRCAPMIAAVQLSWMARSLAHARLLSYVRGLAGVFPLLPQISAERRSLRPLWRKNSARMWQEILNSEAMARRDYERRDADPRSLFLRWYFRIFGI